MQTDQLLFELSHSIRYEIMKLLEDRPFRMTKIGEQVDANSSEVARHLNRLKDAGLVEKDSLGIYNITQLAKLVLTVLPSLSFIARNDSFLNSHDLSNVPDAFILRLNELKEGIKEEGMMLNIQKVEALFGRARNRFIVINNEVDRPPTDDELAYIRNLMEGGFEIKYIIEESIIENGTMKLAFEKFQTLPNISIRVVPNIPLLLFISDGEALVSFMGMDGKIDFSVFFKAVDERFLHWCEDLFEYFWESGSVLDDYPEMM